MGINAVMYNNVTIFHTKHSIRSENNNIKFAIPTVVTLYIGIAAGPADPANAGPIISAVQLP